MFGQAPEQIFFAPAPSTLATQTSSPRQNAIFRSAAVASVISVRPKKIESAAVPVRMELGRLWKALCLHTKKTMCFSARILVTISTPRYVQSELVPKIQDQDRSENGNDYAAEMKSAASARRIEQMGYRSANNRADNPEHNLSTGSIDAYATALSQRSPQGNRQ